MVLLLDAPFPRLPLSACLSHNDLTPKLASLASRVQPQGPQFHNGIMSRKGDSAPLKECLSEEFDSPQVLDAKWWAMQESNLQPDD